MNIPKSKAQILTEAYYNNYLKGKADNFTNTASGIVNVHDNGKEVRISYSQLQNKLKQYLSSNLYEALNSGRQIDVEALAEGLTDIVKHELNVHEKDVEALNDAFSILESDDAFEEESQDISNLINTMFEGDSITDELDFKDIIKENDDDPFGILEDDGEDEEKNGEDEDNNGDEGEEGGFSSEDGGDIDDDNEKEFDYDEEFVASFFDEKSSDEDKVDEEESEEETLEIEGDLFGLNNDSNLAEEANETDEDKDGNVNEIDNVDDLTDKDEDKEIDEDKDEDKDEEEEAIEKEIDEMLEAIGDAESEDNILTDSFDESDMELLKDLGL